MKLKLKIISGFSILALLLLTAGIWSVIELRSIGDDVNEILDENYGSIVAAKTMKESLEREDSAVLLFLLGHSKDAIDIIIPADSLFLESFNSAKQNITIKGEKGIIDTIAIHYKNYSSLCHNLFAEKEPQIDVSLYAGNYHLIFNDIKYLIDRLIDMNDKQMYKTGKNAEIRSRRAVMPGIIAIVSAIVFTVLFSYVVNRFMVAPIVEITKNIERLISKKVPYNYTVATSDEISDLNEALNKLSSHVTG
ncbi:MAG: hypothetical protein PVH88_13985 [Ignavibacteria bacterium]|jgi:methyl-accepting chemotaxis protein